MPHKKVFCGLNLFTYSKKHAYTLRNLLNFGTFRRV